MECKAPNGSCSFGDLCDGAGCCMYADPVADDVAHEPVMHLVRNVVVRDQVCQISAPAIVGARADYSNPQHLEKALEKQSDLLVALLAALINLRDPRIDSVLSAFGVELRDFQGRIIWP